MILENMLALTISHANQGIEKNALLLLGGKCNFRKIVHPPKIFIIFFFFPLTDTIV